MEVVWPVSYTSVGASIWPASLHGQATAYSTLSVVTSVTVSVCPFVCYHVFCDYVQRGNDTNTFSAIYTGLILKKAIYFVQASQLQIIAQAYLDRVRSLYVS